MIRKLFLLLAVFAIGLTAAAEIKPSAEIEFLGVPLGSDYTQFEEVLVAKKFKFQKGNKEVASFTGKTEGHNTEVICGLKEDKVIMVVLNIKIDMLAGGMLYQQMLDKFMDRYPGYRIDTDTSNLSKGTAIAFFGPDGSVYLRYKPSEAEVTIAYSVNSGEEETGGASLDDL